LGEGERRDKKNALGGDLLQNCEKFWRGNREGGKELIRKTGIRGKSNKKSQRVVHQKPKKF